MEWFKVGVDGTYDNACRECFKINKSSTVSWFLSSSYCYYVHDESILSDTTYDRMCKWMLDNYDSIDHHHKHLVTKEDLLAASGFAIKREDYPTVIQVSCHRFMNDLVKWRTK